MKARWKIFWKMCGKINSVKPVGDDPLNALQSDFGQHFWLDFLFWQHFFGKNGGEKKSVQISLH